MQIVARRHVARRRDMGFVRGAGRQFVLRDKGERLAASRRDDGGRGIRVHLVQLIRRAAQRSLLPAHAARRNLREPRHRPVDIRETRRSAFQRAAR
ncbi:hypothetical protein [Paraburkholderia terrae]|uniref:hypothetical protein n=1 Tax=Paraburkholderia terrae TaxID=311230 RepID=UPI001EE3114E|nr:hypothetical protein [Paraburkholderia terrae]